jgi:hypothetical protein
MTRPIALGSASATTRSRRRENDSWEHMERTPSRICLNRPYNETPAFDESRAGNGDGESSFAHLAYSMPDAEIAGNPTYVRRVEKLIAQMSVFSKGRNEIINDWIGRQILDRGCLRCLRAQIILGQSRHRAVAMEEGAASVLIRQRAHLQSALFGPCDRTGDYANRYKCLSGLESRARLGPAVKRKRHSPKRNVCPWCCKQEFGRSGAPILPSPDFGFILRRLRTPSATDVRGCPWNPYIRRPDTGFHSAATSSADHTLLGWSDDYSVQPRSASASNA